MIDPVTMAATSDLVIGLLSPYRWPWWWPGWRSVVHLRGSGAKGHVPAGEVAVDAPTDVELERSAEATRRAAVVEPEKPTPRGRAGTGARTGAGSRRAGHLPLAVWARPAGLLSGYLGAVRSRTKVDAATWDDLEEALIRADVGVGATDALLEDLRTRVKSGEIAGPDALVDALKADLVAMLSTADASLALPGSASNGSVATSGDEAAPVDVWLFVGVNGVGKTTTVGKVANRLAGSGTKVLLAAGDTFRAAAGEQLAMWASRAGRRHRAWLGGR